MKIHLEWGAEALKIPADAMVIVDCLSFTTGVSVACARGAKVYPYLFRQSAQVFADKLGVQCAGKRKQGGVSLSPPSLQNLQNGAELVLPSPNGSTLTLSAKADVVLAGTLRNAGSIANYLRIGQFERVVFVAAGERWVADGSLRPAYEDLIACGAIISLLGGVLSPEAQASVDAYNGVKDDVENALLGCQSGIELSERGWEADVIWASDVSVDVCVPRLCHLAQTYAEIGMGDVDGLTLEILNRKIGYYGNALDTA